MSLRDIILEMILLDESRRRQRRTRLPWPNLDDSQAASRMSAVKRRRGKLTKNQLKSFRWADSPENALHDLKLRAKGSK